MQKGTIALRLCVVSILTIYQDSKFGKLLEFMGGILLHPLVSSKFFAKQVTVD